MPYAISEVYKQEVHYILYTHVYTGQWKVKQSKAIIPCIGICIRQYNTSGKIIQLNEYGCRDAPCENRGNKDIPLAILSRILAQSCVTLCLNYVGRIVLVSLIVLLRGYPCFHDFSHGASLHIQLNDFSTCSTYFSGFAYKYSYAHAYMRSAAPLSRVSLVKWRRSSSHALGS